MQLFRKKKRKIWPALLAIAVIATAITYFWSNDPYHIDQHIPGHQQDTLMTEIVTYMGVKPKHANWQTRHEAQYRKFYAAQAQQFSFYRYYIDQEGYHYFYIIRPARHALGNRRAVGGRYKMDSLFILTQYEEVFVTHVMEEETLKKMANELFTALIHNEYGDLLQNRLIIEWPDDRLKYDLEKKEWRYDVK